LFDSGHILRIFAGIAGAKTMNAAQRYDSPDFHDNLYENYRRMREEEPVFVDHSDKARGAGCVMLFRYDDVAAAFLDPRIDKDEIAPEFIEKLVKSGHHDLVNLGRTLSGVLLFKNPPDHTRLRGLISKAFTPRAVEGVRGRIEIVVNKLLDLASRKGSIELIREYAVPIPLITIAEILGVPPAEHHLLKKFSAKSSRLFDLDHVDLPTLFAVAKTVSEFSEYLRGLVNRRRLEPRDDLISRLVSVHEKGDALTEDEIVSTSLFTLIAGHETTTNLIGNGVLALLQNPEELSRLRNQPELLESAIEELLRFYSPIQRTSRRVKEDLEIRGVPIRQKMLIGAVLGSANRDPERFPEPDRLDIGRKDNAHLAFGGKTHFCLGANLARVEGYIAIQKLIERFPNLRPANNNPDWIPGLSMLGLSSLPLSLGQPS
jgi:cytochrome P450